jgi:hypothetical protein
MRLMPSCCPVYPLLLLLVFRDPQQLLMRCAHAAEVHPRRPASIIVFGGYSRNTDPEENRELNMTDELLLLHTDR